MLRRRLLFPRTSAALSARMGRGYAPKESDDTTETPGGAEEAHGTWPKGRGELGASKAKVVPPFFVFCHC
jgi:hypothetical protein